MKKSFRELKAGDSIYVVNEGTSVGYVCIEEYKLEEPLHEMEKIPGTYCAKQKNYSYPLIIHETLLDCSKCGFIFTDIADAFELYKEKCIKIKENIENKLIKVKKEQNDLLYALFIINTNLKIDSLDELIISKHYEDN